MFDVDAYLQRIRYQGPTTPDAATLRAVHMAHLEAVPFENLDIHLGRPIVLDEDALFQKVVVRRRGGFCYELNGLFSALLRRMGFRVTRLSAGVLRSDGSFGPEFDHMCLMVELEERWLADVGFGDSFCEPLRLDDPSEQRQGGRVYRVAHDGCQGTMLFEDEALGRDEYRFSLQARRLADYEEMCRYHQTSPKSSFTQRSVCSIATPGGRTTLRGLRLITTGAGGRRERLLTETERQRVLRTVFGIEPGELTAPQDV